MLVSAASRVLIPALKGFYHACFSNMTVTSSALFIYLPNWLQELVHPAFLKNYYRLKGKLHLSNVILYNFNHQLGKKENRSIQTVRVDLMERLFEEV